MSLQHRDQANLTPSSITIFLQESPASTETLETPDICTACRKIQRQAKVKHKDKLVEFRKAKSVLDGKIKRETAPHVNIKSLIVEFVTNWKMVIVSDVMIQAGEQIGIATEFDKLLHEWAENLEVLFVGGRVGGRGIEEEHESTGYH